jgi:hypothetical protein
MRALRFVLFALLLAQFASCGPESLPGPGGDEVLQSPPPDELAGSFPDDPGVVMPSGVDPTASRPPPPPFDR